MFKRAIYRLELTLSEALSASSPVQAQDSSASEGLITPNYRRKSICIMPGEPHSKRRKLDTDVVPKAGQHGEWQPSGTPLNGTESSTESTSSSEYSVSTNLPHNAPSTTGIGTTQNRALASAAMYSTAGNTSMASPPYRQGLHVRVPEYSQPHSVDLLITDHLACADQSFIFKWDTFTTRHNHFTALQI